MVSAGSYSGNTSEQMKVTIVKVGGKVLEDPKLLSAFIESFKAIQGVKWLVHGGGKRATEIAQKLGIESNFIEGRRVTSSEFLDVAIDTFAGVNKKLVALLQYNGISALGLCGADLNVIPSKKRSVEPIDYGFVGDPIEEEINLQLLDFLLNTEITPVFSALSFDPETGTLLNTNADGIAGILAAKIARKVDVEVVLAFEKPGVLLNPTDDASVIAELSKSEAEELKQKGAISEGMIPKIASALKALESGVEQVRITSFDTLQNGTLIQL